MAFSHYLTYSAYPSAEPIANSVSELFAADIPAQSTLMGISAILSVFITSSTSSTSTISIFLPHSTDNTAPNLFERIGTLWNVWGLVQGKIGHCLVFKAGLDGDEHVNHSLTTMDTRCGEMGFARKAIGLFMEMREEGFEPDEMTLVNIVLGACGDLGLGRWVEGLVLEKKMEVNSYVGSALIDMYDKCGDLISARRVFDSMPNKDVVTWNAIITWKREASAEGRRLGKRRSCGLIWVEALLLRGEEDAAEEGGFGWICCRRGDAKTLAGERRKMALWWRTSAAVVVSVTGGGRVEGKRNGRGLERFKPGGAIVWPVFAV
ncbi:hypothetical protein POTOM_057731 [Populus tomentosa]|uniref:Pentatricopeptide repeat-containing protein n=1 Tax=Populus tomentosa TaxID=118781 RepID=A0A8X8C582_POPTO|nr:hypothetical protein POTOM_057731 [Populus tomentosa]